MIQSCLISQSQRKTHLAHPFNIEVAIGSYIASNRRLLAVTFFHVKHWKPKPEGIHGQLEGCNRNLRPKAAVAKVLHGNML